VALAGDRRPSTPRILRAVAQALRDYGLTPRYFGAIPTPALALHGMRAGVPVIMVTGSHIPDDRNGIKFYRAEGEILKADEAGMRAQQIIPTPRFDHAGMLMTRRRCPRRSGRPMPTMCSASWTSIRIAPRPAGASPSTVTPAWRGRHWERSSPAWGPRCSRWASPRGSCRWTPRRSGRRTWPWPANGRGRIGFDAIVSADGDGDRPLIGDARGEWLRGDIAGILCARHLGAQVVATPVSSNSAVENAAHSAG
jgi:phosphomannomutase